MTRRLTHIIFDLDGTLLDSEPLYTRAAERVCQSHGATFTYAIKRAVMGGDTLLGARMVVDALQLPITPEAYVAEREVELLALFAELQPIPHAHALIEALGARGIPMAIATSGHRKITEAKLAYHPFLAQIPVRICGDDPRLKQGKPAPDIFLLAAQALGALPEACVVVEDSMLGVHAAVAAGMHTVALVDPRYGFSDEQFAGAACIVHSLEGLTPEALGFVTDG
jgi:HAD superfamily hydrolase (TIGR01509 family)